MPSATTSTSCCIWATGRKSTACPSPNKETVTLADYPQRYAQYRGDADLQKAHRQHPWIVVWDDHESENDSWVDGAENHTTASECDWSTRRAVAAQAWFEWMPVRENPYMDGNIYCNFRFGNLIDLVMLDTRLEGRIQASLALANPEGRLFSAEPEAWFFQQINNSKDRGTRWRFIGRQVMMHQLWGADEPITPTSGMVILPARRRQWTSLLPRSPRPASPHRPASA